MDVSTINDINVLKIMAYDAGKQVNLHQHNLQVIEGRMAEITSQTAGQPTPKGVNGPDAQPASESAKTDKPAEDESETAS